MPFQKITSFSTNNKKIKHTVVIYYLVKATVDLESLYGFILLSGNCCCSDWDQLFQHDLIFLPTVEENSDSPP